MKNYSEAREFLTACCREGQKLATLGKADVDELVITAVMSPIEPGRPAMARMLVVAKNETLGGALLMDRRKRFSDFPEGFPCLRFDPPIIDPDWPERPEIRDDDHDRLCGY